MAGGEGRGAGEGRDMGKTFKSGLAVIVSALLSQCRASLARRPDGWEHPPSNSCWSVNNKGKGDGAVVLSLKKGAMILIVVGMIVQRGVQTSSLFIVGRDRFPRSNCHQGTCACHRSSVTKTIVVGLFVVCCW